MEGLKETATKGEKERQKSTLVRIYISLRMVVERSKSGFPLNPPASLAKRWVFTGSGLEMVVLDIIWEETFRIDKI